MGRLVVLFACTLVAAATTSTLPAMAAAATFTVTSTADRVDDNPGDGVCHAAGLPAGADCTLRAAVQEANATAGPNTILLSGGTFVRPSVYQLTIPGAKEDAAATGDLDVTGQLTIKLGGGLIGIVARSAIIDGGGLDRVFDVKSSGSLTLVGLTVRNGNANVAVGPTGYDVAGGGIRADGDLVLSGDTITGNAAYVGGGVYATKSFIASGTTFSHNTAVTDGNAIFIQSPGTLQLSRAVVTANKPAGSSPGAALTSNGSVMIADSTFDQNSGGAIVNEDNGSMTLTRSTIVGNTATSAGGGLYNNVGTATLVNDTFAGNGAPNGGNVFNQVTPDAVNTIFEGATSGGNCSGERLRSKGHNLDDGSTCGLTGPGDLSNQNPLLGPLADNGGPTLTEALLPGSRAIDAGDLSACPATDQRGVKRPTGNGCDIGAYEFAVSADLALTLVASPVQVGIGQPITFTATVLNKGPSPATGTTLTEVLPAGVTVSSVKPSAGSCTVGAVVVCSLGGLADQANATVTIVAVPSTAGMVRAVASVKALEVDPDPTTNSARAEVLITGPQTTTGGTRGFSAKLISARGRRVHGRAHVRLVLIVSKPVTARLRLLYRGHPVATKSTSLRAGRRVVTLTGGRLSGAGRYLLRIALADRQGHHSTLAVRLRIR